MKVVRQRIHLNNLPFLILSALLSFVVAPGFGQSHLLISEVYVPSSSESGKAFVEIYNPADQAVAVDAIYLSNYNTYYQMVNAQYSSNAGDFVVRFPSGQIEAKQTVVIALDAGQFKSHFGKTPDFEVNSSDAAVTDMIGMRVGANPLLEFTRGMIILFSWNGSNDLVADLDYVPWGLAAFSTYWMDKTGVAVDGPDADTQATTYLNDKTRNTQQAPAAPSGGLTLQRNSLTETDEAISGGNGVGGHNEATENWKTSFSPLSATPGSFISNAGDGSGLVTLDPDTVSAQEQVDLTFTLTGTADQIITSAFIELPESWQWTQLDTDIEISGTGAGSAQKNISSQQITLSNLQVSKTQPAVILVKNISLPADVGSVGITFQTAAAGGTLTPIGRFPVLQINKALTIEDIQTNFAAFNGQTVTFQAVVTIGVNITRTDRCDAFVQDASGYGINLSATGTNYPLLIRGNKLRISGTVGEYQGSTQISNFSLELVETGQEVPKIFKLTTQDANDLDREGSLIETVGIVTDMAANIGGGTNITINDGTGEVPIRIWDSSGLNLSGYAVGDTVGVHAIVDIYLTAAQLLIGYQGDIYKTALPVSADGSGEVTVSPDSVGRAVNQSLEFNFKATSTEAVASASVQIPLSWGWSGGAGNLTLSGAFISATADISGKTITLNNFTLTDDEDGLIIINGLTTPDADTASTFIIKTASESGTLREIETSPVVLVGTGSGIATISIADARDKTTGSKISIKGVVTIGAGVLRTNFTDAYIQDESGYGINIYRSGALDNMITRGNLLIMQGELDDYQGKKEITNYKAILLKSNAEIPAVQQISTFEASTTAYEGSFCEIKGLITSNSPNIGGGTNIVIDDGSGQATVRAWDTAQLRLLDYKSGDYVTVRGVAGIYNSAGQLLLCYQEDIFAPSFEGMPVTLKIENKPFAPDKGEVIKIEYSAGAENSHITLRIFDMSGRLIATLKDGEGLPIPIVQPWDGTDQLGQDVPLGTYICHLEVVNQDNGKRTEKIAPIVVGTILR
jgi:DNA/RNA endonuclease YhcR with UshA esterase domain